MESVSTSLALLPFEPAPRGPVPQSVEFVHGHSQTAKPRRVSQGESVPPVSFGALLAFRSSFNLTPFAKPAEYEQGRSVKTDSLSRSEERRVGKECRSRR